MTMLVVFLRPCRLANSKDTSESQYFSIVFFNSFLQRSPLFHIKEATLVSYDQNQAMTKAVCHPLDNAGHERPFSVNSE